MSYNRDLLAAIAKREGYDVDMFDLRFAGRAMDLFDMFMDATEHFQLPSIHEEDGSITEQYPKDDTRCIVAAVLAAATLIAPK